MRGFRSTLLLVVVFLALLGLYFYERDLPDPSAPEDKPTAFVLEADDIEELTVTAAGGDVSTLRKDEDGWHLVAPEAARADETELTSLTQSLASLEIQRVVDENASDLAQYGLEPPRIDVAFRAGDQADPTHLLLGDKTPTGTELYARTSDGDRVFLISSYLESTFNKTPFALRDKAILKFERNDVTSLEITRAGETVSLVKEGADWNLSSPLRATGDYSTVEGIIGQIHSARMTSVAATSTDELGQYGLDRPTLRAVVVAGGARQTLEVGGPAPQAGVYARDSSRPLVFTIPQVIATELDKPAADYRRKDLFDFRSFNATAVELTRDNVTAVFEKVEGSDEDASDAWRQVAPTAQDVDSAAFESAIAQLSGLRIQSFTDTGTATGLDSPVAEVLVKFDAGGREERVTFGRSGSNVYAARADEPGAARIDASIFDSAMGALDDFR